MIIYSACEVNSMASPRGPRGSVVQCSGRPPRASLPLLSSLGRRTRRKSSQLPAAQPPVCLHPTLLATFSVKISVRTRQVRDHNWTRATEPCTGTVNGVRNRCCHTEQVRNLHCAESCTVPLVGSVAKTVKVALAASGENNCGWRLWSFLEDLFYYKIYWEVGVIFNFIFNRLEPKKQQWFIEVC